MMLWESSRTAIETYPHRGDKVLFPRFLRRLAWFTCEKRTS